MACSTAPRVQQSLAEPQFGCQPGSLDNALETSQGEDAVWPDLFQCVYTHRIDPASLCVKAPIPGLPAAASICRAPAAEGPGRARPVLWISSRIAVICYLTASKPPDNPSFLAGSGTGRDPKGAWVSLFQATRSPIPKSQFLLPDTDRLGPG